MVSGDMVTPLSRGRTATRDTPRSAPRTPPVAVLALILTVAVGPHEGRSHGGVPRGWKFSLPSGDPIKGKKVFANLECHACHPMPDQGFPATKADKPGPSLVGMGGMHPPEYFAESIIAPDNVLLAGPGWIGPDGRSIMPSYADALTIVQLVAIMRPYQERP